MSDITITRSQLRTDLPPIVETEGSVNVVLTCVKEHEEDSCIPAWQVVNTVWYNKYSRLYLGWLPLEDIPK